MDIVHVLYLRDAKNLYGGGISYATKGASGMDLRACFDEEERTVQPGQRVAVPAGICVEVLGCGAAGFIYSRSGLGTKGLAVAQGVGVVDADYRGELIVWLINTSKESLLIRRGERVAQLVFQPVLRLNPVAAEALSETERGAGGFGHTGRA